MSKLLHCLQCEEPFVISEIGVTCGCAGPIRCDVPAVTGFSWRELETLYPGNFQETKLAAETRAWIGRIRRGAN